MCASHAHNGHRTQTQPHDRHAEPVQPAVCEVGYVEQLAEVEGERGHAHGAQRQQQVNEEQQLARAGRGEGAKGRAHSLSYSLEVVGAIEHVYLCVYLLLLLLLLLERMKQRWSKDDLGLRKTLV